MTIAATIPMIADGDQSSELDDAYLLPAGGACGMARVVPDIVARAICVMELLDKLVVVGVGAILIWGLSMIFRRTDCSEWFVECNQSVMVSLRY